MKDLYWICPNCGEKVNFINQVELLFDENNGAAEFNPEDGVMFHTIFCYDCNSSWIMTLSNIFKPNEVI